jgi:hypothetical protein
MSLNFDALNPGGGSPGFPSSTGNITLDNLGISFAPVSGNKAELWLAADTPLSEVHIVFEGLSVDSLDSFVLDSSIGANTVVSSMPDDAAPFELKIENFASGIGGGGDWFYAGLLEFTLKQNITELGVNSDPAQTKATSLSGQNLVAVNFGNEVGTSLYDFDIAWAITAAQQDIPPTITLIGPNPQSLDYATTWTEPGYSAADDIDGDVTSNVVVTGTVDEVTAGDYTITYTVSDSSGNQTVATRTVQVQAQPDTNAPVITLLGQSTESTVLGTPWSDPGYTAADDMDGDLTANVQVSGDYVDYSTSGSYSVTYSVFDAAGNEGTASRTVLVEDLALSAVVTLDSSDTPTSQVTYGSDIVSWYLLLDQDSTGSNYLSVTMNDTSLAPSPKSNTGATIPAGDYTWTLQGQSGSGQTIDGGTGTLTVVGDTTAPVITLSGKHLYADPQMSEIGDAWVEPGVTATDDTDGSVSVTTDISGLDVTTIGTYFVNYSATDAAGNTGTAQRTVVICDNAEPTLTLIGDSSITLVEGSGAYTDAGATAIDGGGDISDQIVISGGPVDTNTVGTYTLTYNVSDASGNAATPVTRTIVIEAIVNVPPVITLTGDSMVMVEIYGGVWAEPGYSAADSEDGDITADVVITYTKDGTPVGAIDDDIAGTYQVIYTVTDSAGDTSFVSRSVMVGEHNCLVVEDLDVTGDTPNLSGLTLVANNSLNYNGTDVDVSAYTSGMWASLAQNVGFSADYIATSSLDVLSISGVALTDVSHWEAFPVSPTQALNLSAYVADRSFGVGIGVTGVQSAPVEETLIKFISYLGERRVMASRTLEMFEELTGPEMSYPFAWHCALDSKFAAQDVALVASSKYGVVSLAENTQFPSEFIQFRLDEMYSRGAIDSHTYHRKRFNSDGAGLVKADGTKYQLHELAANSPKRHSLVESNLKTSFSTAVLVPVASVPIVLPTPDVTATNAVYDQVHNVIDPSNPTQRLQTQFVTVGRFTVNPSAAAKLSTAVLMRSLDNNLTSVHFTPEFLGALYTTESVKTLSRANVLSKVVEIAAANGVDISSYTG